MSAEATPVEFNSRCGLCRGRLFAPAHDDLRHRGGAPCVVLGHGFGGTIEARLTAFAERYAQAGCYALAFDYRHFGASEGEPRQRLSIRRQLQDWHAAIAHVRALPGIDPVRIALMGTSFSGGHVVRVAARDGEVAAVIAQCPMMDGWVALKNVAEYAGWGYLAQIVAHGLRDLLGPGVLRLPIVGPPGSLAAMTTPDAEPGFMAIAPPDFRNEVCARIGLSVGGYRPGRKARQLPGPILIQICEHDTVAPVSAAEDAARRAGARATVVRYPIGHFDVYLGRAFEQSVADQVAFLRKTLTDPDSSSRA